jgi:actin-related protein
MAEPTHAPREQREKLAELFFEKYQVPSFFLCKSAVLAACVRLRPPPSRGSFA